jgi:chromosomal replication initiation ATPase DnaA
MGKVKETFKASLDWVLKFDVIQRIFEGDFGIKPKDDASNSRLDAEKLETTLRKEIDSSDDPVEVKDLREKILRNVGGQSYHNWFRTFPIIVDEQGRGVELQAPGAFQVDWIESNYGSILRAFNIHVSDGSRESSGLRPRALISGHNLEEEKLETLREEIDSGDEIDEAKDLRREILHKLGGGLYQAWFRNLTITIDEQQSRGVRFYAQNQFVKDWIETHYLDKLRSLTSQVIHIFWGEACG